VFLPLLQSSIVILPLLFKLCDFALVILKRSSRLPLLCNIVCLAGIKWRKLKKKKHLEEKIVIPLTSPFTRGERIRISEPDPSPPVEGLHQRRRYPAAGGLRYCPHPPARPRPTVPERACGRPAHAHGHPGAQKLTALEGLNRPGVKSAFVLKSQG